MILSGTKKTGKICTFLTLMCMTLLPEISTADKAAKLNDDGIESYNEQKLEESINQFTEALVERPDSPELRFNRGTALSAAGKTEEAVNELGKSANMFTTKDLSAAAHYNTGNTLLSSGDLNGALEEYKTAVKLDQSSQDIRHNLELALRMIQQQQQQQNQENNQEQDNSNEDNQNKKEEQENQQDNSENENNDEQQEQQEREQQNQQDQPEDTEQKPITPEEAQRILDAMNDEEEKALELRRKMMLNAMGQGDDW